MSSNSIPWRVSTSKFDQLWKNDPAEMAGVPDMLATMFEQQRQHMADYEVIYRENGHQVLPSKLRGDFNARRTHEAFRETMGYLVEELHEARNLLKAKPWKRSWVAPEASMMREELADAWHFFIELMIIAGMTPEDIFEEYFRKTIENNHRKESGY